MIQDLKQTKTKTLMMNILQKISPEWSLRLGLGIMYLYSGIDIMINPRSWLWAIPTWFINIVTNFMPITTYLRIQAASEIIIALALLAWFLKPKVLVWIAIIGTLEMAGILFLGKTGIDQITFRDIGLLGGLLALVGIFASRLTPNKNL